MAGRSTSAKSIKKLSVKLKPNHRIGIAVSDWNTAITSELLKGSLKIFEAHNLKDQLIIVHVPGSFELPLAAKWLMDNKKIVGVIGIGCVIKGQTKHDEYINHAISKSFADLALIYNKPLMFGVLTTNNVEQAKQRAGGKFGNKGEECALGLLQMLNIKSLVKNL